MQGPRSGVLAEEVKHVWERHQEHVKIGEEEEEERRGNIEGDLGNEDRGLGSNWEFNHVRGTGLLTLSEEKGEQQGSLKEQPNTEGPIPEKEKKERNHSVI